MYQVIARKYRPQNFDELIGQEHVQTTLSNAIQSGRLAHGYIFSGQRGTGKTTVARILARCLNCVHGPTVRPCGVCSSCVEIASGSAVDVLEVDAASNRGINEIREIRENVRYRPARDRYKIFIVDEAHQITKDAFNALLKTLEEPPEWVVFILCTTEANEIPNTIASRCQHFTFRSVEFTLLMDRMRFIVQQEGIQASDEVLSVIAQAGEGSVRDSLSALDQAIACCGTTLSVDQIRSLLGLFGAESFEAVANAIVTGDGARMLEIVAELESSGQSLHHFSRELSRYWRNLLVAKISGKATPLIAASDAEQERLREIAKQFSEEDLTRYLNLSLELYQALQESLQPRLHLELGLVKLVHAGRLQKIEEALAQLGPASTGPPATPTAPTPQGTVPERPVSARTSAPRPPALQASAVQIAPTPPPVVPSKAESAATQSAAPAPPPADASQQPDLKTKLHQALLSAGMSFSADALAHSEISLQGAELLIRAPKAMMMALRDAAADRVILQSVGHAVKIRLEAGAGAAPLAQSAVKAQEDDEFRQRALSHPGVKRFQELFPGAHVRAVRNLNE